jgi:hypothetical protein
MSATHSDFLLEARISCSKNTETMIANSEPIFYHVSFPWCWMLEGNLGRKWWNRTRQLETAWKEMEYLSFWLAWSCTKWHQFGWQNMKTSKIWHLEMLIDTYSTPQGILCLFCIGKQLHWDSMFSF